MTDIKYDEIVKKINLLKNIEKFVNAERIVYCGNDSHNFIALLLAGLIDEKTFYITNSKNDHIVFTDSDFIPYSVINELFPQNDFSRIIFDIKTKKNSDKIALVTNTSGSTGVPKYVSFTYKAMLVRILSMIEEYGVVKETGELIVLPITSSAIIFGQLFPSLFSQSRIRVIEMPFNLLSLSESLTQEFDYSGITPTILKLLQKINFDWRRVRVKNIAIGGEIIDFELLKSIHNTIGKDIFFPMYGLSETGGAIAGKPLDQSIQKNSVGKKFKSVQVKIETTDSEILIKDPGNYSGYVNNSEYNVDLRDGWVPTGDIGRVDDKGFIYILGRKKNVIISGGVNIYAEEIEKIIGIYPKVVLCKIIRIDDSILGEAMKALVIVENVKEFNDKDFKFWMVNNLSGVRLPKVTKITDDFTLIGMGKGKEK